MDMQLLRVIHRRRNVSDRPSEAVASARIVACILLEQLEQVYTARTLMQG